MLRTIILLTVLLFAPCEGLGTVADQENGLVVLVTGATGRTGRLLYSQLKASSNVSEVRAFVTNVTEAREVLNCSACDASEGIYLGNVTDADSLATAAKGCDTVAIAVGAPSGSSPALQRAIEFEGVENTVSALATSNPGNSNNLQVVLCSSMGTTNPNPPPYEGGALLHWKLNAEAFIMASEIGFTIVKPCGLTETPGGERELLVGHDDKLLNLLHTMVPRADVARVMTYAIEQRLSGLRFDLCSQLGKPTVDLAGLIDEARYPWVSTQ